MSIITNFVLLLKAQKDDPEDEYELILKKNNYTFQQVKTIDFNYVNLSVLKNKLLNPNGYNGIVFSSPRCVNAVKLALDTRHLPVDWKSKSNYVVGEATYKAALKELDLDCLGRDTGNADVLSQLMLKESTKCKMDFLYPHGNLKMDILKDKFEGTNLTLNEILVYETVPNKHIRKEFQDATNNFKNLPEYIVFFSPSGVKAVDDIIKCLPTELIKMIAIGPTTEAAMINAGLEVFGTAEKPTAQHVLNILL
ncbi:hypothetical protein AMK59_3563 [Oryctes borbonicus]|uniref:Uroporphyrinogen-III synthase n=1 Tax=Oryctes borbonicus TaxID=1629725 RepID=A0A0T6B7U6_9SCAR|nr:hypothetical protein AMK59_3563 [Oryctes borbonicus]